MIRGSELVTYALSAAAIASLVYVVADRDKPTTSEAAARAGMLFRVFRPDEVTRITMDRKSTATTPDEKIELVRQGDLWSMTSPRIAPVDFLEVTSLLNYLQGARSDRAVGTPSATDRVSFGLETPRVRIELAMKGVTLRIAIGGVATGDPKFAPSGEVDGGTAPVYAEVSPYGSEPGGVFVVSADLARALDRPADAFRDRSLMAGLTSGAFQKITVRKGATELVTLNRAGNATFRVVRAAPAQPARVRANVDVVDALFGALGNLKADAFINDSVQPNVDLGGGLEIDLAAGGKLMLAFGGACPGRDGFTVVKLSSPVLSTGCVPGFVTERLLKPAEAYLDTYAFGLIFGSEMAKTSEIESIVLEKAAGGTGGAAGAGDKPTKWLDAERRGDGLHLRLPNDEQVDKEGTDRFLGRIAQLKGDIVAGDRKTLGLDPPVTRVILRRRVDALTKGQADAGTSSWEQVVEIGALDEKTGFVHLRRLDDDAILRVRREDAEALGPGAVRILRSPNLMDATAEAITKIKVLNTSTPFELEHHGGTFGLISPAKMGVDGTGAAEILRAVTSLGCLRWAADRIPEGGEVSFGFDKPTTTLELTHVPKAADAGAPITDTVDFGGLAADGVYARVRGRDGVCVVAEAKRDLLARVPMDRGLVGFDPSVTPVLTLVRSTTRRTLRYQELDKRWVGAADAGVFADAFARKLADRIVGLRTEALVHLGPAKDNEGFGEPSAVIEGSVDGAKEPKKRVKIGSLGRLASAQIYYVRIEGEGAPDATFAILRDDVDRLLSND